MTLDGRVRAILWGSADTRIRASWRVLLAMPVLWILTGGVLTGNVQSAIDILPAGGAPLAGLTQSLLHAGFVLIVLSVWARYLDRQALVEYGISATPSWGRDFFLGFSAILVGFGFWIAAGAVFGDVTVDMTTTAPERPLLLSVLAPFVALVLHAAVQQVVFFRVILATAAEGLQDRGLNAIHAAIAAIPVTVLFFVLMHGEMTPLRVLDLVVAGTIFSLLYLHTGELALGMGAHTGGLYAGIPLTAIVQTTGSLQGLLGTINQYGFPKMIVAYVLIAGWLRWRQRKTGIVNTSSIGATKRV